MYTCALVKINCGMFDLADTESIQAQKFSNNKYKDANKYLKCFYIYDEKEILFIKNMLFKNKIKI